MPKIVDKLLPAFFFIVLVAAWQIACDVFAVPDFLLPSPLVILQKIAEIPDRMLLHAMVTLREIVIGFALATVGGITLAAITAHSRLLSRTIFPLLVVSQTIPTIAIAPVLVIWFGPGDVARLTVVFLIAFFPIVVNMVTGLLAIEEELLDLCRILHSGRWQEFSKVRLPNALPYFFSSLKVASTLAVIGAIIGEFVGGSEGLGHLIIIANTELRTSMSFVCLFSLSILGFLLYGFVVLAERVFMPWEKWQSAPAFAGA